MFKYRLILSNSLEPLVVNYMVLGTRKGEKLVMEVIKCSSQSLVKKENLCHAASYEHHENTRQQQLLSKVIIN